MINVSEHKKRLKEAKHYANDLHEEQLDNAKEVIDTYYPKKYFRRERKWDV